MKRCALFVDFDNVYSHLLAKKEALAHAFGFKPDAWLPTITPDDGRLLVMRCYLNPQRFARYRSAFLRNGFDIVDCPSLTSSLKNGADIQMTIDVLDVLRHQTHFDEIIILSSDSDFTPLLRYLRAHDRNTTVCALGATSSAYKALATKVVVGDEFTESLEKASSEWTTVASTSPETPSIVEDGPTYASQILTIDRDLLKRVTAHVLAVLASRRTMQAIELPNVFRAFQEFPGSSWFGCHSLRNLVNEIVKASEGKIVLDMSGRSDRYNIRLACVEPKVQSTDASAEEVV